MSIILNLSVVVVVVAAAAVVVVAVVAVVVVGFTVVSWESVTISSCDVVPTDVLVVLSEGAGVV